MITMHFYPVHVINWTRRKRIIYAGILMTLNIVGGGTAFAIVADHDFARYQVILDKKPFGEVIPSEAAQPQVALGEVFAKEFEMKAIVDDDTGIRIGLWDKKSNKNISLRVGENYEDILLFSVNLFNEEAVLKKGDETALVKMRPDKDKHNPLIFEDNFDRQELGADWKVVRGQWKIENRALAGNGPAVIIARKKIGKSMNLTVEYDAVSDAPGDLSLLLNVTEQGDYMNGYFFGVGSENNAIHKILACGIELGRVQSAIKPGQQYHIVMQRTNGQLKMTIAGQEVLIVDDPMLFGGENLGFYIWTSGQITNLKVVGLPDSRENDTRGMSGF